MNEEARIRALVAVYQETQRRLDALIANSQGDFTVRRAMRIRSEIDTVIAGLEAAQREWAQQTLPEIYVDRRARHIDRLARSVGDLVPNFNLEFGALDQRRVNLAVQAAIGDLEKATGSLKTYYNGWLMRAGYVSGDLPAVPPSAGFEDTDFDREMTAQITAGIAGGETRRQTSRVLQSMLEQEVGEGGKVAIRCADGKVRRYDPKKYAELVARTRTREISNQSTRATMQAAEAKYNIPPLLRCSHTPGECSSSGPCAAIDGRTFSERQGHPRYPWIGNVRMLPHPHCRHTWAPFVELTDEDRKYIRRAA